MYKLFLPLVIALFISACADPAPPAVEAAKATAKTSMNAAASSKLVTVLAAQPEETRERYPFRHPKQTLQFFDIKPGTVVVEALPGGGWYTRILLSYLGPDGSLVGADYPMEIWPLFGFFPDEYIEKKKTWTQDWPKEVAEWNISDSAKVSAFVFGARPDDLDGHVDAVLFIRALHNLNRFESTGGFLTTALSDAHRLLKPGGIVGVVQHEARPEMPDAWADGSNGYLKKDALIASFEAAGFEFVGSADFNNNPKDQPTAEDIVWRLPPSYFGTGEDPVLKAKVDDIGESNRMTLKFRKR